MEKLSAVHDWSTTLYARMFFLPLPAQTRVTSKFKTMAAVELPFEVLKDRYADDDDDDEQGVSFAEQPQAVSLQPLVASDSEDAAHKESGEQNSSAAQLASEPGPDGGQAAAAGAAEEEEWYEDEEDYSDEDDDLAAAMEWADLRDGESVAFHTPQQWA